MLVRHGDAGGLRLPHELKVGLTKRGQKQVKLLGRHLAREKFDHIYASDMTRALKTARAVVRHHKKTPFTVTEDIREVHSYNINHERNYGGRHLRTRLQEERGRVAKFVRHVLRSHQPGARILVVAHGCLISLLIATFGHMNAKRCFRFGASNASITVLHAWKDRQPSLLKVNDVEHLPPSLRS